MAQDNEAARPSRDSRDRTIHRQRVVIVVACVAAALSLSAMGASLWVKSPQQRAAEVAPPPPSTITAPVRKGVLVNTVVIRGTVVAAAVQDVLAPATEGPQIVTAIHKRVGAKVTAGDAVLQVSGRPILALTGTTPAYRTFKPGLSGPDVRQLQRALLDLGLMSSGDVSGTFDGATGEAIESLYNKRDVEPSHTWDTDPSELASIKAAQRSVTEARRKVAADREAYNDALDESRREAAKKAATESAKEAAKEAALQLDYSLTDLADAESELSELQAASGVQVPYGEVVFISKLPATVVDVSTSVGANLATAESNRVMRLSAAALVVGAVVTEGSQVGIKAGQAAVVTDDVARRTTLGTVAAVGKFTAGSEPNGGGEPAPAGYPVTISPEKPLSPSWLGASVRIAVTLGQSKDAVLIVPLSAIVTGPDGITTLTVANADLRRQVRVKTGLVAGGEVQVTALSGDQLTAGEIVVVG